VYPGLQRLRGHKRVAKSGLWQFLVSLIPEGLRPGVNAARHLVVQDIAV
jgi:hypothetical protein